MPATTQHTKQELIDAAVAVVVARTEEALRGDPHSREYVGREYIEAYAVATALRESGMISHPDTDSRDHNYRERARKALDSKVKRLLDEEVAKPNARILRFSSRDQQLGLPRLNGMRRRLSGNAVGYTTPELYERAQQATATFQEQQLAQATAMVLLLARATAAGLPEPLKSDSRTVTYGYDALLALVERLEGLID